MSPGVRQDDDEDYDAPDEETPEGEAGICPHCSGSGEGQYDGSTCRSCKGKGEI